MIDDLSSYDIHVMLVEGQRELLFYVWSYNKEILDQIDAACKKEFTYGSDSPVLVDEDDAELPT